jgi:hypothetical protein
MAGIPSSSQEDNSGLRPYRGQECHQRAKQRLRKIKGRKQSGRYPRRLPTRGPCAGAVPERSWWCLGSFHLHPYQTLSRMPNHRACPSGLEHPTRSVVPRLRGDQPGKLPITPFFERKPSERLSPGPQQSTGRSELPFQDIPTRFCRRQWRRKPPKSTRPGWCQDWGSTLHIDDRRSGLAWHHRVDGSPVPQT